MGSTLSLLHTRELVAVIVAVVYSAQTMFFENKDCPSSQCEYQQNRINSRGVAWILECFWGKAWVLPLDYIGTKIMHTHNVPLGSNI